MVDEVITKRELIDAQKDAQSLEDFINGSDGQEVVTRLAKRYPTLANAIRQIYEKGGKFYPTLAAANSDIANIRTDIYVITGDNGAYYKATAGATTLTKSPYDPLNQSKNYTDSQADKYTSDVLTKSTNLFNDDTSTKNNQFIGPDGGFVAASTDKDWVTSDFIEIKPNQAYYYDGFRYIAYYTKDKVFISRASSARTGDGTASNPYIYRGALTSPPNAYYVRVNYRSGLVEYSDGRKVNLGSNPLPYQEFTYDVKNYLSIDGFNIEEHSVSTDKLSFIEPPKNLFNASACTIGKAITDSGELVEDASFAVSEFIKVDALANYTMSGQAGYAPFVFVIFFDKQKRFLGRISTGGSSSAPLTFKTVSDTAYIRLNINISVTGLPDQRSRMLNFGNAALPYEQYKNPKFVGVSISDSDKSEVMNDVLNVVDLDYGEIKSKFVKSNNLFDASAATLNKVISATGVISDASDYHISDFISVVSGQKYTLSGDSGINAFITTAYYDANKNFVQRVDTRTTSGPFTITIPVGVSYLRFNMNNGLPTQRNRMFNIGETALPYEPYVSKLANVQLDRGIIDQISDELIIANTNTFMYDLPIDNPFYTDAVWTEYSNFRTITSDQVYAMYDGLVSQHPSFITKHTLANNSLGQSIAYYKFKPQQITVDVSGTKLAKVFLLCGQHGMEHTPPLATFLMMREMYNNWQSDPLLEALRFNVEFVVLPVANPDGWNKFTRLNPNGVDLNRNYPVGWVQTEIGGMYSGTAPFSEIETQNVRTVFDQNTDIDIFYDFHNFNGTSAATHPHIIWVSALSDDKRMARMAQCLTSRMTRHWRKEYTFIPAEPYFAGIFDSGPHAGMAASYAKSRGAKLSTTFELGNQWWIDPTAVPHDTVHKRTTMEAITNFVLISLNELKRI